MKKQPTAKADLVIVGGGVLGNSVAFYYARNNPGKKVIVLERNEICNAATSRAAALLTRVRAKREFIPLAKQTYEAISEMEKLLSESMHLKRIGMLHIAASESKVNDLHKLVNVATKYNEPWEFVSAEKAEHMVPWLNASSAQQIAFMPEESYCDPYLLGTFYARCAKLLNAEIMQGVEVRDFVLEGKQVKAVITTSGYIETEMLVIACGVWSPLLALKLGVGLPLAPVRSQYWITEKNSLFPAQSPMVLLPDANAYFRPEGGALLFGIREKKSLAVSPSLIPSDISNFQFSADRGINDLSDVMQKLLPFFPAAYDTGLKYYIAGFSAYTPDNYLSMGATPKFDNLLFATGCVGAGISVSGGVGLGVAEMAAKRPNPFDFSAFNIERFGNIDPLSEAWLQLCASARSEKTSG